MFLLELLLLSYAQQKFAKLFLARLFSSLSRAKYTFFCETLRLNHNAKEEIDRSRVRTNTVGWTQNSIFVRGHMSAR